MPRPFPQLTVSFRTLVIWFVSVDLCFIVLNVIAGGLVEYRMLAEVPELLRITQDWSLPEDFNYLKWLIILLSLFWIALRDRWLPAALWALVFTMILLDDSLQVHENFGEWIALDLDLHPIFYLFGSDLGEIMVFLGMALITLAMTAMLLTRFGPASCRMTTRYLAVLVALGVFGVGVDALHQILAHLTQDGVVTSGLEGKAFGLIEDGGEMLIASFATAMTLAPPAWLFPDRLCAWFFPDDSRDGRR